jgi:hypothetical protein
VAFLRGSEFLGDYLTIWLYGNKKWFSILNFFEFHSAIYPVGNIVINVVDETGRCLFM